MSRRLHISTVRMICLGAFYLFVLLVYAASAQAQPGQLPGILDNAGQREAMATRLQLSDAQRQAITPVLIDYADSTRAIMAKYAIDPLSGTRPPLTVLFAVRKEMKASRRQLDERLVTILTPEQMVTFKHIRDERRRQVRDQLGRAN